MKRFTETTKWKTKWFRKLPDKYKLFWLYILDSCDSIGIWDIDFELAEFIIQGTFNEAEILEIFSDKVEKIKEEKLLILDFVEYQYGILSENSRPHQSYIKQIKKHKLESYFSHLFTEKGTSIKEKRSRLTIRKKEEIKARDKYVCQYCGYNKEPEKLVIDHIKPLIAGGDNEDDNLLTSCIDCNTKKNIHNLKVFIDKYNLLDKVSKKIYTLYKSFDTLKDKEKDKDKEKAKDKEKVKEKDKPKRIIFTIPELSEITEYFVDKLKANKIMAEKFYNYYESNGWKVGKNKMKSWEAACRNWKSNDFSNNTSQQKKNNQYQYNSYTEAVTENPLVGRDVDLSGGDFDKAKQENEVTE